MSSAVRATGQMRVDGVSMVGESCLRCLGVGAGLIEAAESVGEPLRADADEGALELAEAAFAAGRVADDQGGPLVADELGGPGDRAAEGGRGGHGWRLASTVARRRSAAGG